MYRAIESLGKRALDLIDYFGALTIFTLHSIEGMFQKRHGYSYVMKHVKEIGIDSLPLAGIVAAFTGMVLVMETVTGLKKFGAEMYSGGIVSVSMIRELGPVIIALIIAGRVGAAIAAEIGTMRITEQIDALEVLAVDPIHYLVSPRLLGGLIAMPSLFMLVFFLAIGGGFLVGVHIVGIGPGMYWNQTFRFVVLKDLAVGMLKILVFIVIIINASCFEGFRAKGGAEGVGRASTQAVVSSFFLIILWNLIITALFYSV